MTNTPLRQALYATLGKIDLSAAKLSFLARLAVCGVEAFSKPGAIRQKGMDATTTRTPDLRYSTLHLILESAKHKRTPRVLLCFQKRR
jgi:hypothetical protein